LTQTFLLLYILVSAAIAQPAHKITLVVITQLTYKKIIIVAKVYTDKQKYNRSISFNYKLTIFHNICKRSGLSYKRYITIFLTMLKGLTKEHYYSNNLTDKLFKNTYIHIQNFFKRPEYY
jgi:hypothetical protein